MLLCRASRRSANLFFVSNRPTKISRCPANLVPTALELVLRELTPDQRHAILGLFDVDQRDNSLRDGLFIAEWEGVLCGAAWGQRQPGNTAILWLPQLTTPTPPDVAADLTSAVVDSLDRSGIEMTQALLLDTASASAGPLESTGFQRLAELVYLSCDTQTSPDQPHDFRELAFVPYDDAKRQRLVAVIERTYEATLDCAAMNGKRQMDDVLDGYRATGVFRPENWLIIERAGRDIGVLLVAEEPAAGHCELVYMGIVPEARGKGFGVWIARHAVQMARVANADRIVLAVDAANVPALEMYARAGFTTWDRRVVYVRFRGGSKW
jgi:mycothiol synthase